MGAGIYNGKQMKSNGFHMGKLNLPKDGKECFESLERVAIEILIKSSFKAEKH